MKKQVMTVLLVGSMALAMAGCGAKEQGEPLPSANTEAEMSEQEDSEAEAAESEADGAEEFSFSEFEDLQFTFYSGAGAWGTVLRIEEDGSFSGVYTDSEMGLSGEGYPNGTVYQSDFSGKFTEPVKENDFTWSMEIQEITYEKEPNTEEIIDNILYCYAKAFGLDGAEEILLYAPHAPLAELPEEYKNWVPYIGSSETEKTELTCWGLYNEAQECGFASHNMIDRVKEQVAIQEEYIASLEASLENDDLTQAEYNETSESLYQAWDYALNDVWRALKQALDEEEMQKLTLEEREWIAMKEQVIKEAGEDVEGGSMQPMVRNLKGAELTKNRVYELLELLE